MQLLRQLVGDEGVQAWGRGGGGGKGGEGSWYGGEVNGWKGIWRVREGRG